MEIEGKTLEDLKRAIELTLLYYELEIPSFQENDLSPLCKYSGTQYYENAEIPVCKYCPNSFFCQTEAKYYVYLCELRSTYPQLIDFLKPRHRMAILFWKEVVAYLKEYDYFEDIHLPRFGTDLIKIDSKIFNKYKNGKF